MFWFFTCPVKFREVFHLMSVVFDTDGSSHLKEGLMGFDSESGSFYIRIQGQFESSHYLYNYFPDGSDEPMHGHTWEVEIFLEHETRGLDESGISIDFLSVRKRLDELLMRIDHNCINNLPEFLNINPTSENIAKWFYRGLKSEAGKMNGRIRKIIVHEGPKNYAVFIPE